MASYVGLPYNNPTKYLGPDVKIVSIVTRNRQPTGADVRQGITGKYYPIGSFWIIGANPTTGVQGDLWYLSNIAANVAYWLPVVTDTGGIDGVNVDAFTPPGTNPVIPTGGFITVTGGQVASGTNTDVIQTNSLADNTFTIQIQRSIAAASSTIGDNGVSHFNSNNFSVDANGFVSALGFSYAYTNVSHTASPYTVLSTDYYISVDCSGGAVTLNFPNAPVFKQEWIVKDRTGSASTNAITLTTPGGSVPFDGTNSYTMVGNYDAVNIIANTTPAYEVF